MAVNGSWILTFKTPAGEYHFDLVLTQDGKILTGTFDGSPIREGLLDEDSISFKTELTSPFKLKITCTATVDDTAMVGTAKATMMSVPFTGAHQRP